MELAQWDQRLFNRTLEEYMKVCPRTFSVIVNTKSYYVARKALWFRELKPAPRIAGC